MPYGSPLRCVLPLLAASTLLPLFAVARSQDSQSQSAQSVAEAARRARAQKEQAEKKNGDKQAKIITNDEVAPTPSANAANAGVPMDSAPKAETGPPSAQAVEEVVSRDQGADAKEQAKEAHESPEVAQAREKLDTAKAELDVVQRQLALDRADYYSKPNYADDSAGKAKLDGEQQQIDELRQQVEQLQAQLDELKAAEKEKSSRQHKGATAPSAAQPGGDSTPENQAAPPAPPSDQPKP
jgi:DNA repair exonuclease SbcCD ATPase subunit